MSSDTEDDVVGDYFKVRYGEPLGVVEVPDEYAQKEKKPRGRPKGTKNPPSKFNRRLEKVPKHAPTSATNLPDDTDSEEGYLTKEQFQKVLPRDIRSRVSDEVIANINRLLEEPELRESFRDNLLSYPGVMNEGKFKLTSYIDACRFVTYKLLGASNVEAYVKTFPDRYQRLMNEKTPDSTIAVYASGFNKTQLVNKILEQTLVPVHVLNADIYQKAINTQAYLMVNANSEKVRTEAANSLLNHLKRPETNKIQLDIGYKKDQTLDDLRATTQALVEQQRKLLQERSVGIVDIAQAHIVPKEDDTVIDAEYSYDEQ